MEQRIIRELIIRYGELEDGEFDDQATLIGDLEFDSIKIINLMVAIEEGFGIEFDDMEMFIEKFERVGEFVRYIMDCIEKS